MTSAPDGVKGTQLTRGRGPRASGSGIAGVRVQKPRTSNKGFNSSLLFLGKQLTSKGIDLADLDTSTDIQAKGIGTKLGQKLGFINRPDSIDILDQDSSQDFGVMGRLMIAVEDISGRNNDCANICAEQVARQIITATHQQVVATST